MQTLNLASIFFSLCLLSTVTGQVELTSSIGNNFHCEDESVVYTCTGVGTIMEWFFPPVLDETSSAILSFRSRDNVDATIETQPGFIATLTEKSPDGMLNLQSTLTVDPSIQNVNVTCRVRNGTDAMVTLMEHRIEDPQNSTNSNELFMIRTDSGVNDGAIEFEIVPVVTVRVISFNIEMFIVGVRDRDSYFEIEQRQRNGIIGVNGQSGTTAFLTLSALTRCGTRVTMQDTSIQVTSAHSPGTLTALSVPVLLMALITVIVIIILVIVFIVVYRRAKKRSISSEKENINM